MDRVALVVALALCALGCGEAVSPGRAKKAVEDEGYTGAVVTAQHGITPELYGCDKSDAVAFDVDATNAKGSKVSVTVCCGLVLKGCTIRH